NNCLDIILHRRSIRRYQDRPIEREKTETLLQAALASPSSKHLNPWEFVVVEDKDMLCRMAGCRTYGSQMLKEAAAGIVICMDASQTDTWQCDGAIAAENILLCASDMGLGACWVQVYNREGAEELVRSVCKIPEQLHVLCIISLGYPNEEKRPINPEHLQYDKIHYGQY
ncbi:MAG TPA: NAD(P)H nitroreductase, partial [Bacteroidales bacterium]|nr:NAD(P)H nitroreductase [Bacteroidales bacterium]